MGALVAYVTLALVATTQANAHPLVIAHRGASAHAPENTLAALRHAIAVRAHALEIDVRQSKDGHLVLMHDATVDRTTNGTGSVADLTLTELKTLDAGSWFDRQFADERIPTLDEVIDLLDSATLLIIEVKGDSSTYPDIERNVVDAIKRRGVERQVVLKSFQQDVLERFRSMAPEIPRLYVYAFHIPLLGLIIDTGISAGSVFEVDATYLQPHWFLLSRSFVRKAHARGFKVVAWGVNSEEQMRKAIDYGVDGIETDHPERLLQLSLR